MAVFCDVPTSTTHAGASKMDTDDAESSAGKLPLLKCLEVLTAAAAHSSPDTVATFASAFAPCMCACLAASRHWSVRAQCCRLTEKVFKKVLEASESKSVGSTLLSEGEAGVLACALDVSTEKVSQVRLHFYLLRSFSEECNGIRMMPMHVLVTDACCFVASCLSSLNRCWQRIFKVINIYIQ